MNEYPKKVLVITKNLMFIPRIESEAGSLAKVKKISSIQNLKDELKDSKIIAALIDLEDSDSTWEPILKELQTTLEYPTLTIAYGPHKNIALMDKAKELGCDHVLAKGAFLTKLRSILKSIV